MLIMTFITYNIIYIQFDITFSVCTILYYYDIMIINIKILLITINKMIKKQYSNYK